MKITYDLTDLPERRRGSKESEEVTAIKAFMAGTRKNMGFEYEDEKEAKRRYDIRTSGSRTGLLSAGRCRSSAGGRA